MAEEEEAATAAADEDPDAVGSGNDAQQILRVQAASDRSGCAGRCTRELEGAAGVEESDDAAAAVAAFHSVVARLHAASTWDCDRSTGPSGTLRATAGPLAGCFPRRLSRESCRASCVPAASAEGDEAVVIERRSEGCDICKRHIARNT